jgi:hypothetical protein
MSAIALHPRWTRISRNPLFLAAGAVVLIVTTLAVWTWNGRPVAQQSDSWYIPLTLAGGLFAAALVQALEPRSRRGSREGEAAEGRPTFLLERNREANEMELPHESLASVAEPPRDRIWERYLSGTLTLEDKETLPALIKELHREITEHLAQRESAKGPPKPAPSLDPAILGRIAAIDACARKLVRHDSPNDASGGGGRTN